jgi:hypothetical protein
MLAIRTQIQKIFDTRENSLDAKSGLGEQWNSQPT